MGERERERLEGRAETLKDLTEIRPYPPTLPGPCLGGPLKLGKSLTVMGHEAA